MSVVPMALEMEAPFCLDWSLKDSAIITTLADPDEDEPELVEVLGQDIESISLSSYGSDADMVCESAPATLPELVRSDSLDPDPKAAHCLVTSRAQVLLNHRVDTTHFERPLFALPIPATINPRDYLLHYDNPFSQRVVDWQRDTLGYAATPRTTPLIEPLATNAVTLISIFYPDPNPAVRRRPVSVYIDSLRVLASANLQTIIYTSADVAAELISIRPSDPHWIVISDWPTVWDVPNNVHQRTAFHTTQPALFDNFVGRTYTRTDGTHEPNEGYNTPHLSAVYNAKAFITYDAIMRNPFGSSTFVYVDSGLLRDGFDWNPAFMRTWIDPEKMARAIKISRTSGVVMGEYDRLAPAINYGFKSIDDSAWTDPSLTWQLRPFISNVWAGDALGMLNFSLRCMMTVDEMGANGLYVAREEFIVPHVAVRYPNTVFMIPSRSVYDGKPFTRSRDQTSKLCWSASGGPAAVPGIHDPIAELFCEGYVPRHKSLAAGEYCVCELCEMPL